MGRTLRGNPAETPAFLVWSHSDTPTSRRPRPRQAPREVSMDPHVIVLFGAAGDLSRRKLLPGLYRLNQHNRLPEFRIIGTSIDELDDDAFRRFARDACDEFVKG